MQINIELPDDVPLEEAIDTIRRKWAEANIKSGESYGQFANRIGVSYRTVLRWLGHLNSTNRIVRRALRHEPTPAFDLSALPIPIVWTATELAIYRGPLVYVAIKESVPVYVGSSKNGAARILGTGGQHDRLDVLLNASHVYFYKCATRQHAKDLESQLIRQYQPLFNVNQT